MKKLIHRILFGEVQGEPIGPPNPRTINAVSANLYEVQPYVTPTRQGAKRSPFSTSMKIEGVDRMYLVQLDNSWAAKIYRSHCLPPEFQGQGKYRFGIDVAQGKDETVKATFQVKTSMGGESEFYLSKLKRRNR